MISWEAMEQQLRKHESAMFCTALKWTKDWNDAQDVVQEAKILAFRKQHTLRYNGSICNWLHTIVVNAAHDWERRKKRCRVLTLMDEEHTWWDMDDGDNTFFPFEPTSPSAEKEFFDRYAMKQAVQAFNRLSNIHRATLGRYCYGHTYGRIAEELGIPENTVRTRIFKAREKMRRRLDAVNSA